MSERRYSIVEVAETMREIQGAIDKEWESPSVQAARAKAHATLDKVATLSPEEQQAYWDRVSANIKAKTEELKRR